MIIQILSVIYIVVSIALAIKIWTLDELQYAKKRLLFPIYAIVISVTWIISIPVMIIIYSFRNGK